jgi:hypothetical protein
MSTSRDPQVRNLQFSSARSEGQVDFIVTVYDEDGLKLAATNPCPTPTEVFVEARKIVDNNIEGPRKKSPSDHPRAC